MLHGSGEQCPRDAALLQVGKHGQRAEEADASPIDGKVGADQFPVERRAEGGDVRCALAAERVVPIGPECVQVRGAKKRTERNADNPRRFRQILFVERRDGWLACRRLRS